MQFLVPIGRKDVRFNTLLDIDILYLDFRPALHAVDAVPRFSVDRILIETIVDSL